MVRFTMILSFLCLEKQKQTWHYPWVSMASTSWPGERNRFGQSRLKWWIFLPGFGRESGLSCSGASFQVTQPRASKTEIGACTLRWLWKNLGSLTVQVNIVVNSVKPVIIASFDWQFYKGFPVYDAHQNKQILVRGMLLFTNTDGGAICHLTNTNKPPSVIGACTSCHQTGSTYQKRTVYLHHFRYTILNITFIIILFTQNFTSQISLTRSPIEGSNEKTSIGRRKCLPNYGPPSACNERRTHAIGPKERCCVNCQR